MECVTAADVEGWKFPVGVTNVRLHDLRHSFASFALAGGASLFMVSKLLGHKQIRSSEVYAHLADDPIRQTANRTGNKIKKIMKSGTATAKVVKIAG